MIIVVQRDTTYNDLFWSKRSESILFFSTNANSVRPFYEKTFYPKVIFVRGETNNLLANAHIYLKTIPTPRSHTLTETY